MTSDDMAAVTPPPQASGAGRPLCANCGAPLGGPYCARCGQATRHFIQFFPAVVREITEDTLGVDSRFWRTIIALLFRPGRLTLDYFAGRRVHYSPPFRLYLLTSIVTFLLITPALDRAIDGDLDDLPETAESMQNSPPKTGDEALMFNGTPWDAAENPLTIPGLPAFLNRRLNAEIGEFNARLPEIKRRPKILVDAILGVMPQILFVLLPLFALILKVCYLFSRRLYMEHLIFAVHNHAFVFVVINLTVIAGWLDGTWAAGWSQAANTALWSWLFVYLLLGLKRVYHQGWILTTLKFGVIGTSYSVLLALAVVAATLVGAVMV